MTTAKPKVKRATKKVAKKEEIVTRGDEYGNLVVLKNNGVRIIATLRLRSETKGRRIGVINIAQKTLYIKRSRSKHLFRKNESYGFNHKFLADAKLFDKVRIQDESQEWVLPKSYILENGSFLHFKNPQGFELQIFMPLEKMAQFERSARF